MRVDVEICTDSVEGVIAAERAGAQRAELCADLVEGGTTPSFGSIELARERSSIEIAVMIRPRGGDFLYSRAELDTMQRDIDAAGRAGAHAVVFGLLTADGRVDTDATARLVACARPMQVTFHRAFDMTVDAFEALESLIDIGIDRVLTSGQCDSVSQGLDLLVRLGQRAGDRTRIMPGGGVTAENIHRVVTAAGVRDIHFAARRRAPSGMAFRNPNVSMAAGPAPGEYELDVTDEACIRACVDALGA